MITIILSVASVILWGLLAYVSTLDEIKNEDPFVTGVIWFFFVLSVCSLMERMSS